MRVLYTCLYATGSFIHHYTLRIRLKILYAIIRIYQLGIIPSSTPVVSHPDGADESAAAPAAAAGKKKRGRGGQAASGSAAAAAAATEEEADDDNGENAESISGRGRRARKSRK